MKPNDTPQAFYTYLEKLATKHKQLRHHANEQHYFRGELQDFYEGFRNREFSFIILGAKMPNTLTSKSECNFYFLLPNKK